MEKYILQKAQKIVSALYLITDHIKDSDTMKWEIREEGLAFVSGAHLFGTTVPVEKDHARQIIINCSEKLNSLLNISLISSLISSVNVSIVIHEIDSLISFINKENSVENNLSGYILSDSFFATDTKPEIDKGHLNLSRTSEKHRNKALVVKDKKNNRQENIINLLKKDSNLTIKDFARVIKDCSEKTIQRELILLVEKGVIKRIGERRWSTYSLA